jgi:putative transposase
MLQNHNLAQAISNAGWGEFVRQLEYKSERRGKNIIKIGTFEPSSKTCSKCKWVYADLTLDEREWTCQSCGVTHDRDHNAACNIKMFGLNKWSAGCASLDAERPQGSKKRQCVTAK